MSRMTNTAAPGWYADPHNPAIEHWWDGTRYNGSRAVAAVVPAYAGVPLQPRPAYGVFVSPKSRTVAAVLGFFLGGLGVDRFYLGNIGLGIAKLLVGWLTFGIWPLIDWIIILAGAAHDGEGLPVTNWN
jgi:hypothetical protein